MVSAATAGGRRGAGRGLPWAFAAMVPLLAAGCEIRGALRMPGVRKKGVGHIGLATACSANYGMRPGPEPRENRVAVLVFVGGACLTALVELHKIPKKAVHTLAACRWRVLLYVVRDAGVGVHLRIRALVVKTSRSPA